MNQLTKNSIGIIIGIIFIINGVLIITIGYSNTIFLVLGGGICLVGGGIFLINIDAYKRNLYPSFTPADMNQV